jgi:hypothetical protein
VDVLAIIGVFAMGVWIGWFITASRASARRSIELSSDAMDRDWERMERESAQRAWSERVAVAKVRRAVKSAGKERSKW